MTLQTSNVKRNGGVTLTSGLKLAWEDRELSYTGLNMISNTTNYIIFVIENESTLNRMYVE